MSVTNTAAESFNRTGVARYFKGDLAGAIIDLNKALSLDPHCAEFYNNRGVCQRDLGHFAPALRDFSQAIAINPRYADAYSNRSFAHRALGQLDAAIEDAGLAVSLKPDSFEAYTNRGAAYHAQKRFRRAIADYDKALQINPSYLLAMLFRGNAWCHRREVGRSWADYWRAFEIAPAATVRILAFQFVTRAQVEGADVIIADCAHHLRRDPSDYLAHARQGYTLLAQGDADAARNCLDENLRLNPGGRPLIEALIGAVMRQCGRSSEAAIEGQMITGLPVLNQAREPG